MKIELNEDFSSLIYKINDSVSVKIDYNQATNTLEINKMNTFLADLQKLNLERSKEIINTNKSINDFELSESGIKKLLTNITDYSDLKKNIKQNIGEDAYMKQDGGIDAYIKHFIISKSKDFSTILKKSEEKTKEGNINGFHKFKLFDKQNKDEVYNGFILSDWEAEAPNTSNLEECKSTCTCNDKQDSYNKLKYSCYDKQDSCNKSKCTCNDKQDSYNKSKCTCEPIFDLKKSDNSRDWIGMKPEDYQLKK